MWCRVDKEQAVLLSAEPKRALFVLREIATTVWLFKSNKRKKKKKKQREKEESDV